MNETTLNPLTWFGYTHRQAQWISLVMRHSGVFLRRQFLAFLGAEGPGGTDQRLLSRIVELRHATKLPYHGRERLYHVRARPLYACVGHEHSRLRRSLPAPLIAQRLLVLDFLLREPQDYMASEEAKVECFTERFGLGLQQLPHRVYESRNPGGRSTIRYFVDRYPIAVHADHSLTFVVPDLAPQTAAVFTSFLNEYEALLKVVPNARVIYVTGRHAGMTLAERVWRRAYASAGLVNDIERLHRHFTVRRAFREHDYGQLADTDLKQYGADAERFADPEYARLYDEWLQGGIAALTRARRDSLGSGEHRNPGRAVFAFRHVALPWTYYCAGVPHARTPERRSVP
jgi:hypothetical protein